RGDRRPHAVEIRAEQSTVERGWRQRTPCKRAARAGGVRVRGRRRRGACCVRARFEIIEGVWACRKKGLAHRFGARTDFRGKKSPGVLDLVWHAVARRLA